MTDASLASDEALHFQPEWCRVTLASIGDAVITTDIEGRVTFLNSVAESLTGWTLAEAAGQPLEQRVPHHQRREPPAGRESHRPSLAGWHGRRAGEPQPAHRQGRHRTTHRRQCRPDPQRQGGSRRGRAGVPRHQRTQAARAAGAGRPRLRREHHCDLARAIRGSRQEPAGPHGQRRLLPGLPRLERRDGGPLRLRLGQRPVGHPPPADAADPSPEQQPSR